MHTRFSLGLDFGTESVRALLLDLKTGREAAVSAVSYRHGVIDAIFPPTAEPLPADFALQHPQDYIDAAGTASRRALEAAGVDPRSVAGIGIDFTACTPLPIDAQGEPLCFDSKFEREPHAWVKLWKHHGAIEHAERMNAIARERGESFLARYGGNISSEWLIPKLLEISHEAPRVLEAASRFLEASDWLIERWTGRSVRGACAAGYKGLVDAEGRLPPPEYLAAVDARLPELLARLVPQTAILPAGVSAGELNARGAEDLGLEPGVAVSAPIIDAHAAVPGCGVDGPETLVAILGTSACHMLMAEREILVPGIQGVVRDGILPGYFGYEAGQASFGDVYAWFVERVLGRGSSAFSDVEQEAAQISPGKHGLLALDWWNGNRSVLIDPELSGAILGLHLATTPADIYRALIEATAFGTRRILENFESRGIRCGEARACGGIAARSPLVLQVLADVTGRTWFTVDAPEICARGAALFGAVAAGRVRGGFEDMSSAMAALPVPTPRRISPDPRARATYERMYSLWLRLHDHFGVSDASLMHELRALRHAGSGHP